MSLASDMAAMQFSVTHVTGAWAVVVLKGRNYPCAMAGLPDL
jgi:hypothetical protein